MCVAHREEYDKCVCVIQERRNEEKCVYNTGRNMISVCV